MTLLKQARRRSNVQAGATHVRRPLSNQEYVRSSVAESQPAANRHTVHAPWYEPPQPQNTVAADPWAKLDWHQGEPQHRPQQNRQMPDYDEINLEEFHIDDTPERPPPVTGSPFADLGNALWGSKPQPRQEESGFQWGGARYAGQSNEPAPAERPASSAYATGGIQMLEVEEEIVYEDAEPENGEDTDLHLSINDGTELVADMHILGQMLAQSLSAYFDISPPALEQEASESLKKSQRLLLFKSLRLGAMHICGKEGSFRHQPCRQSLRLVPYRWKCAWITRMSCSALALKVFPLWINTTLPAMCRAMKSGCLID